MNIRWFITSFSLRIRQYFVFSQMQATNFLVSRCVLVKCRKMSKCYELKVLSQLYFGYTNFLMWKEGFILCIMVDKIIHVYSYKPGESLFSTFYSFIFGFDVYFILYFLIFLFSFVLIFSVLNYWLNESIWVYTSANLVSTWLMNC